MQLEKILGLQVAWSSESSGCTRQLFTGAGLTCFAEPERKRCMPTKENCGMIKGNESSSKLVLYYYCIITQYLIWRSLFIASVPLRRKPFACSCAASGSAAPVSCRRTGEGSAKDSADLGWPELRSTWFYAEFKTVPKQERGGEKEKAYAPLGDSERRRRRQQQHVALSVRLCLFGCTPNRVCCPFSVPLGQRSVYCRSRVRGIPEVICLPEPRGP